MKRLIRMFAAVGLITGVVLPLSGAMPPKNIASETLITLFGDLWHWQTQEHPEFATQVGLNDNTAGRLDSYNLARLHNRLVFSEELLAKSHQTQFENITQSEQVSLAVFRDILTNYNKNAKYMRFFHPILSLEGPQLRLQHLVRNLMVLESYNDFQKLLSRYGEFPRQAEEILHILKENMDNKIMPHSLAMDDVIQQLDSLDVPVMDSPFFKPFLKIPLSFPGEQRQTLRKQATERISQDLLPSFSKIRKLLNESYLQNTRPKLGIRTVPNGSEYYSAALEYFTSTKLPPSEVHSIGLSEVHRIEKKVLEASSKCVSTSEDTIAKIFKEMREDTSNVFITRESLVESLHGAAFDEIKPLIPTLFDSLPSDNLTIQQSSEQISTHPYPIWYEPPSLGGNRPGLLHIDHEDITLLSKNDIPAVALSLCYPGRHFHSVFLQVSSEVPLFRKITQPTRWSLGPSQLSQSPAFVEGWAAYSEFMGEELNVYRDGCDQLARNARELAATVRMVVDTGIHAYDWSYEAARKYFQEHTALPNPMIEMELKHIVSFPGKACSAKIGEIKIRELRQRAKNALGMMFSPQEFHRTLLQCTSSLHIAQNCISTYIQNNIHAPLAEHDERDAEEDHTEPILVVEEDLESSSYSVKPLILLILETVLLSKLLS